jgi:hypothetical protein
MAATSFEAPQHQLTVATTPRLSSFVPAHHRLPAAVLPGRIASSGRRGGMLKVGVKSLVARIDVKR